MTPQFKSVIRLDSIELPRAFFTEEGYLKDTPILTTTGIFEYMNPDGSIRRELRLPEDVFEPESLASYKGKPIIITHEAGLITKDNAPDEQIGTILTEGFRDGSDVRAEIIIHDTDSMKQNMMKELSLGYNLDIDETPGVWKGQPYDAIQRNIRINHLALVKEARAGDQARLNIDGKDKQILKGGKLMKKKIVSKKRAGRREDGILSPEELAVAIAEYQAKRADACKKDEELVLLPLEQMDADEIATEVEAIKDRVDAEGEIDEKFISRLYDIIDTLLAKEAFDEEEVKPEAACDEEEIVEEAMDEEEVSAEENVLVADEEIPAEEAVLVADEEEELVADEDEELIVDEDEEVLLDEEEIELVQDEDEDPIPNRADSVDAIARARYKLGVCGNILRMDGLENMSLTSAKKLVIKTLKPQMRLDGKSKAFIDAAFEMAYDDVKAMGRKSTSTQKKKMFNKDSAKMMKVSSAESARDRMIKRMKEGK